MNVTSTELVDASMPGAPADSAADEIRPLLTADGTVAAAVLSASDDPNDATEFEVTALAVVPGGASEVCMPEDDCKLVSVLVRGTLGAAVLCC